MMRNERECTNKQFKIVVDLAIQIEMECGGKQIYEITPRIFSFRSLNRN